MSSIDERLQRFFAAETTDEVEAAALARLRATIGDRGFVVPAGAPSGRRVVGILAGASLLGAGAVGGVVIASQHNGGTRAPVGPTNPTPAPSISATPSPTAAPTPTGAPLSFPMSAAQLDFVDATHAWVISGEGRVLRTTDGGHRWSDVSPPSPFGTPLQPTMFALDADRAWVYGSPVVVGASPGDATVFRTADGGRTWSRAVVSNGTSGYAGGSLIMASSQSGFLLVSRGAGAGSEGVAIYRTDDSGATWVLASEPDPAATGDPFVAPVHGVPLAGIKDGIGVRNTQTAWVAGGSGSLGVLYVTHDGGVDWQRVRLPLPVNSASSDQIANITAPRFLTTGDGYLDAAVVVFRQTGALSHAAYVTHDGGATWTGRLLLAQAGAAQALGGGRGVSIGSDGTVYTTTDDWVRVSATVPHPQLGQIAEPHFVSLQDGWVLLTDNTSGATSLWATSDGGVTFTRLGP